MKLYTAAQMQEADRRAIEERGVPSAVLMERAARSLVREVRALPMPGPGLDGPIGWVTEDGREPTEEEQAEFWAAQRRSAIAWCGPGNNGGDGIAAARILMDMGWRVKCVLVGSRDKMTAGCREMERRLMLSGGVLEDFDPNSENEGQYLGYDVAIDALFGVGLHRDLEGSAAKAARMTRWGTHWVVSADVPSGIHADTGDVMGTAVKADVTVTFSRGKPGLYVGKGAVHAGRVVVADIGIPEDLYPEEECRTMLVERSDLHLPKRPVDGHKGDFGKLFILAGSKGYTGAAALCARAAVRGGAGLVTVAVSEDIYPIVAVKCDEAMVWPWPEDDEAIVEKARGCDAALIGPGLGQGERAERLVLKLMRGLACPVILDADGLNLISKHINVLDEREPMTTILTPHDGEFARLSGCALPIRDRLGTAREFAQKHRCLLVLKGHRTITSGYGACCINPTGNSGMAKGGSGDALAGLMGALLARRGKPDEALAAVWLHGRAGDLAAEDKGEYGMTPSDLIEQIPYAFKGLTERG